MEEVPTNGFYRESSPHKYTHAYIHVHTAPPAAHEEAQIHAYTVSSPGLPCEMLPSIWPQYPGQESIELMSVMGRHESLQRC